MEKKKERILFIAESQSDRTAFEQFAQHFEFPYEYRLSGTVNEVVGILDSTKFDAVVTDYWLGGGTAFDFFDTIIKDIPIVVVVDIGDEEIAASAMQAGASEVVIKDSESRYLKILSASIGNAVKKRRLAKELQKCRQAEKERNKLRLQRQQVQRMEAIGTLAGGVAHSFNNIIGVIMGCAELAMLAASEEDSIHPYLEQIYNAGHRASDLVRQILTFSRQRDGEKRALKISIIIKEALIMLRASLPVTIEIKQNVAPDSGMVLADPTQIYQVLMNLCTNAAHAMRPNGGVLEVTLANADLTPEDSKRLEGVKPGAYVKLTVSDTGGGMDKSVIERIFDPYFTTKKTSKGSGLGLTVVHDIISHCGGGIEVQSEPGKGASFQIFIPRFKVEKDEAPVLDFTELPKGDETILFVDDDKRLVDLAQKMLKHLGYRVTTATGSTEALQLFMERPHRFDLVITDFTMPRMTGDKLSEKILQIRPDIPIILCSGFSEMISKNKVKSLGVRGYILKPLIISTLASKVRKVLDHTIDE